VSAVPSLSRNHIEPFPQVDGEECPHLVEDLIHFIVERDAAFVRVGEESLHGGLDLMPGDVLAACHPLQDDLLVLEVFNGRPEQPICHDLLGLELADRHLVVSRCTGVILPRLPKLAILRQPGLQHPGIKRGPCRIRRQTTRRDHLDWVRRHCNHRLRKED
jgi:hypothetical protein